MPSRTRHLLLVNPSSGGGRGGDLYARAEALLHERGIEVRTVVTRDLDHGLATALEAARAGEPPIVMSGDGLIGQIGGALAGQDVPLAIMPSGRGNDFGRVLGIPSELEGAADVIAAGDERLVDVGVVNGRPFLCIASLGFDSDANRIANDARLVRGNLVYAYAALRALAAWRPATFTVRIDGESYEVVGYSVAVANSRAYGGGMFIAPEAELDDGLLDVVATSKVSKLRFLANLPKVFKGAHVENDEVTVRRGSSVEITADREFAVYADGEHLTDLPATITVRPSALRVIAPPGPLADPPQ